MTLPVRPTSRLDRLRTIRDLVDREICDELGGPDAATTIATIGDLYDVTPHDILGRSRTRHIVAARHATAWLMHRQGKTFRDIAAALGIHHSAVVHACNKIEGTPAVRALILGLETQAS